MKLSEVVEALASKYGFNEEEAFEFIRSSRKTKQPKLKIVEEPVKLKSILRKSYCKKRKTHRVKFEYGVKCEDDEPLEEYSPPVDYLTMKYDVIDGYFVINDE
jgi:hypothetical protein